jgi:hypothetical protein
LNELLVHISSINVDADARFELFEYSRSNRAGASDVVVNVLAIKKRCNKVETVFDSGLADMSLGFCQVFSLVWGDLFWSERHG